MTLAVAATLTSTSCYAPSTALHQRAATQHPGCRTLNPRGGTGNGGGTCHHGRPRRRQGRGSPAARARSASASA
ncbi:MAG: hypothetical protein WA890_23750, partial [Micromonospora sp.]